MALSSLESQFAPTLKIYLSVLIGQVCIANAFTSMTALNLLSVPMQARQNEGTPIIKISAM